MKIRSMVMFIFFVGGSNVVPSIHGCNAQLKRLGSLGKEGFENFMNLVFAIYDQHIDSLSSERVSSGENIDENISVRVLNLLHKYRSELQHMRINNLENIHDNIMEGEQTSKKSKIWKKFLKIILDQCVDPRINLVLDRLEIEQYRYMDIFLLLQFVLSCTTNNHVYSLRNTLQNNLGFLVTLEYLTKDEVKNTGNIFKANDVQGNFENFIKLLEKAADNKLIVRPKVLGDWFSGYALVDKQGDSRKKSVVDFQNTLVAHNLIDKNKQCDVTISEKKALICLVEDAWQHLGGKIEEACPLTESHAYEMLAALHLMTSFDVENLSNLGVNKYCTWARPFVQRALRKIKNFKGENKRQRIAECLKTYHSLLYLEELILKFLKTRLIVLIPVAAVVLLRYTKLGKWIGAWCAAHNPLNNLKKHPQIV